MASDPNATVPTTSGTTTTSTSDAFGRPSIQTSDATGREKRARVGMAHMEALVPSQSLSKIDVTHGRPLLWAYCLRFAFNGFRDAPQKFPIYYRKEFELLALFLGNKLGEQFALVVDGVPGAGKSVTVWSMALDWMLQEGKRSIMWLSFRKKMKTVVLYATPVGEEQGNVKVLFRRDQYTLTEVNSFISAFEGDIIILDGINEGIDLVAATAADWYEESVEDGKTRTLIVVASGK